jgi:hypothetical protein
MGNFQYSLLVVFVLIISGCATADKKRELALKRATFDFDCHSENLKAVELSPSTYGVSGCGKKGTYVIDCPRFPGYDYKLDECHALLNSPNAPTESTAPAQPTQQINK